MNYDLFRKSLFGGVSGFISTTLIYPFDTLRSILQNSKSKIDVIKNIKPINFYNGYLFNLTYVIPEKALKIGINDYLVKENEHRFKYKTTNHIVSGSIAGFLQSFITTPAELIKIRKQIGHYNNYIDIIKSTKNLYRGLQFTILRDVPFTGIFFPLYYSLNDNLRIKNNFAKNITAGLGAGIVATIVATPVDVIKTRYQISDTVKFKKILNDVLKEKVLFRGIIPRIISIASLYSITMAVFELQKNYFL